MELSVKPKTDSLLLGKVSMLLSRWNGLQMAIQNEWGGHDSHQKSEQLAYEPPNVEDLENLLHENLLLSFNTDIEDGSIEEVAEQLMNLHEEYLQIARDT